MTALSKTKRYQAYPEYKDSRIDWLDVVPSNWNMSKVKYLAPFQVGWTPSTRNDDNFMGENLWVNISDLKTRTIVDTVKRISDKAAKEASMDITPQGSLMYSFKLSVGAVSFAGKDMYTNEAIASFLATAQLPLNYLYYALPKFIIENASTNIYGAKILNQELINNAILLAPPVAEAENIANFLDHETVKIDTLIEKQQQLIELLKKKRQAVISNAVTKGLDPDVPMKDSGVEWLGEVPEHWDVAPLKYLVDEKAAGPYGASLTKAMYTTSGIKVYGQQQVISNDFTVGDYFISEGKYKEMTRYTVFPDDVLISVMGTVGKVAVVPKSAEFGIINPRLVRYKFASTTILPRFVQALIMSLRYQSRLSEASQGSTMEGLNMRILGDIPLAFPNLEEQAQLLDFIDKKITKYSTAISKAQEFVELSSERRTTLISAAVTGKIDVRDWKPPQQQDEVSI
jgi:type I restriction enzyme S subunit